MADVPGLAFPAPVGVQRPGFSLRLPAFFLERLELARGMACGGKSDLAAAPARLSGLPIHGWLHRLNASTAVSCGTTVELHRPWVARVKSRIAAQQTTR